MNRPKFTDKKYQYSKNKTIREDWIEYNKNLEKYCNELEEIVDSVGESNGTLARYIQLLEKALDKACELLQKSVTETKHCVDEYGEFSINVPVRTKEDWKEVLMKEAQDE